MKRSMLPEIVFFPAFLYKVAENVIYPALRKLYREEKYRYPGMPETNSLYSDAEDKLLLKQYDELLEQAVSRLPHKQQQTFILIKKQGLKREEVAAMLQVSPETVKSNLDQAVRSVRAYCLAHIEFSLLLLVFMSAA